MEVVVARPPNFDAIIAKFPFADRAGVVFTYGQTIYNPSDAEIPPWLKCHEAVHAQRQGEDPEVIKAWWDRYLEDALFRLEEELVAHRAEYRAFRGMRQGHKRTFDILHNIADRLASPLYGNVISYAQARRLILVDVDHKKVSQMLRHQQEATA